jgi:hypothetical protein
MREAPLGRRNPVQNAPFSLSPTSRPARRDSPDDQSVYPWAAEYPLFAGLLIADGDPQQAVLMLGR